MVIAAIAGVVLGQGHYNSDPRTAAILSEQRYLSGDGKFGAAYSQEDGINFKEETDADGTRHGSYSYVDPTGQRRTISYTAGKNGFQASGDHLPQAPPAPPNTPPQPQYQPLPQYQPPQPAQQYNSGNNYDSEGQYDPRYNDPGFTGNQQSNYQPAPQPAYNPPQPAYNPPRPAFNPTPQPQYQQQYQQPYQPPQNHYTTEPPHRFQPPGKLSLNRTPDGFSYSFNKVK